MADLGTIETEQAPVNQAAIDRANASLARGVGNLGDQIEQKVEDDILGDARARFEQEAQNARPAKGEKGAGPIIEEVQSTGDDPQSRAADKLLRQIRTFEATIAQGSSAMVGRAKLGLKQALNDLQKDHPSFTNELAGALSTFVSGSATLEQLAIDDARINAGGTDELASRRLRELEEQGYAPIDQGGMAIPRTHLPNSPEFARLFVDAQVSQQLGQKGLLAALDRQNKGTTSLDKSADDMLDGLVGKGSHVQQVANIYARQNQAVLNEFKQDRNVQNSDIIYDWEIGGGKEAALQSVDEGILEVAAYLNTIPLNERQDQRYLDLVTTRDDMVTHLTALRTALDTGDIDLMDSWKVQNAMRMQSLRGSNMDFDAALLFGELVKPIYGDDAFQTLTKEEFITFDMFGRNFDQSAADVWASMWSSGGKGELDPDSSPEDRRADMAAVRANTATPFADQGAVVEMTDTEIAEATSTKFTQIQRWANQSDRSAAQGVAILDAFGNDLDRANLLQTQYFDIREETVDFVNSESVFELITNMKASGQHDSVLVNFVDIVSTQFNKGGEDSGLDQVNALLTGSGGKYNLEQDGTTIGGLIDYNFDNFEKSGVVSVVLNAQKTASALPKTGRDGAKSRILRDVRAALKEWQEEVHAMAVLDFARGVTIKLDYRKAAEDNGMFVVFNPDWFDIDE
jgi:hypothetical protein